MDKAYLDGGEPDAFQCLPGYLKHLEAENVVWANETCKEVGRRLYFPNPAGGALLATTGGPLVFANSKAYQITVRYPSNLSDQPSLTAVLDSPSEPDLPLAPFDFDLEGEMESEEETEVKTEFAFQDDSPSGFDCLNELRSSFQDFAISSSASLPALGEGKGKASEGKGKDPEPPQGSHRVGKEVMGTSSDLDYSLVELEVGGGKDRNLLSYELDGSSTKIRVRKTGNVDTIHKGTTTALVTSDGLVPCTLSSTPHPMRLEGRIKFHSLYQVKLNDENRLLEQDQYGSCVVETLTGEVFGHIVRGYPGTSIAYMVPMEPIIGDIERLLGTNVLFVPGSKISASTNPLRRMADSCVRRISSRDNKKLASPNTFIPVEPRLMVEFGSPKYFQDLGGPAMPKRHLLRGLRNDLQGKVGAVTVAPLRVTRSHKVKKNETFEDLFFSLPVEIQDMVVNELPFRSAMNLRHVSRRWRSAVKANAHVILSRFLTNDPLPPLVRQLYHNTSPDLQYIDEIGHRYTIVSKLAGHISKWLACEIYLHKSRYQQQQFQERRRTIQKRLIPPLFTALHFFETYPRSLLLYLRSQCQPGDNETPQSRTAPFPFEEAIMSSYSEDILLQTQEMFEILIKFFDRIMRPPSDYGRVQKLIHGYLGTPSTKEARGTIMCFGGLGAVLLLAETGDYNQRLAKAGAFISELRSSSSETRPSASHTLKIPWRPLGMHISPKSGSMYEPIPIPDIPPKELGLLLDNLPGLDNIWSPTAKILLANRRATASSGELMRNYAQALTDLVKPGPTLADRLYEGHHLFHALLDTDFGDEQDFTLSL